MTGSDDEGAEPEWRPHQVPSVRVFRADAPTALPSQTEEAPDEAPPAPAPPSARRVLGVNLAGGVAQLAVVEVPDRARLDLAGVLAPDGDLEPGARLVAFSEEVRRTLERLQVSAIAVARPVRYTNWRYADALERASLETCFMMEAHRLSMRFESVGQHHAANVVGLPLDRLDDALPIKLGIDKPKRWTDRYPAVLVALAVAQRDFDRA